jgi:pimeloyl-ACP methyl ester carboxylesterase
MKALIPRLMSIVSRLFPRLGAAIAWYFWFRPHGRKSRRYPEGAEEFTFDVLEHVVNGFTLGAGEPVILLHGWGGVATDMAPLAAALADAGYQAVVPDLPGHGADRKSTTDVFRMAAAVDALVARYGRPAAVVAHSFGAVVTFAAFQHGGVDRAVLVAPAINSEWFLEVFRAQLGLGDRAFARFRKRFVGYAGPQIIEVLGGNGDIRGAEILILHDPDDDRTPFVHSAEFAGTRTETGLVAIPESGHKGILRDAVTREAVLGFIASGLTGPTAGAIPAAGVAR